ncbi:MAG: AAA-like domain-containing protein [Cyanobacteria bacterium J06632_22]
MGVGFPDGSLAADSPLYVTRPPIEDRVLSELQQPGSLVRIRAAPRMGKSSLLVRTLQALQRQGYRTALVDFRTADRATYTELPRFLRWLCAAVAHQLKLPSQLDSYWDNYIGAKLSCTCYWSHYLLPKDDRPLVLALNEVNHIFAYPDIAEDVLALLRFWYEEAKRDPDFGQLRQVVVHSTDVYVPLNIHQSPFNVGLPIQLPLFTAAQVRELAQRYGVTVQDADITQLVETVGGHPYLSAIALYHLSHSPDLTMANLLNDAATDNSIYGSHLRSCVSTIQEHPHLQTALKKLQSGPVLLPKDAAYPLTRLGLATPTAAGYQFTCQLYRQYFAPSSPSTSLSVTTPNSGSTSPEQVQHVQQLKQENQRLKALVNIDSLTRIANRRYLDCHMQVEWQRMINSERPLSLIILDIDCFKQYNDTYGHRAGDRCLQQVASTLRNCLNRPADLAARYGGEEFAVILPMTDTTGVKRLSQMIQQNILALGIPHETSTVATKVITVSIGAATAWPRAGQSPETLFATADSLMYASKRQGRNRVTVSQSGTTARC